MTLFIIGLGIYGEPSIPSSYYSLIKKMNKIYMEKYTSPLRINLKKLENLLEIDNIIVVERKYIEEENYRLIREVVEKDIALLVPGDPLIATTYTSLILDCVRIGAKVKIIHSSSALCSAIGESGLHTYKFGPFCTLMREGKASSSRCYEILRENMRRGIHTLFFLEYDYESDYIMKPDDAIRILLHYDKEKILNDEQNIIVLCGLGSDNEFKTALKIKEIYNKKDFPNEPCILIVPGKLHFSEREYLMTVLRRRS